MHEIDLAQADLNLLVVLDVLLQERNVTRAAERLHRTQSATSHALSRLRELFDDPILVRVGGQMRPTPRAERLAEELPRVLRILKRMLGEDEPFDPAHSDRIFTFAAPDFMAAILPSLVQRIHETMPEGGVELLPPDRAMYRDLADGRTDLVVAPSRRTQDGVLFESLGRLDWAVFARHDHPAVKTWNAEAWARYSHIRVRTSSDAGPVDRAADAAGLTRRLGAYLPHFWLAPPLLASTDMLLTVPRVVLADIAPQFGLVALASPFELPPLEMAMAWNVALDRDPAIGWFRQMVQETFSATEQVAANMDVVPLVKKLSRKRRRV